MTQPNNLSKVWRCERCSRCREGDFAHCKNTKYRIESATPAAIDSSPVYSKSIDDVPAAINPQPVWILPAAWLHYVAQDDGTQDQALSFSRDSFPLQGVGGFHSTKALPLFLAAPTPAEIMLAYENMIEERATLARQLAEANAECSLLTHKVITCGVAARHPDPNLSRTGAYAGEWNSNQAEDVRALRDRAEQAEAQLAQATARLAAVEGLVAKWLESAKLAANGPMYDGASEYAVAGTYAACADELDAVLQPKGLEQ